MSAKGLAVWRKREAEAGPERNNSRTEAPGVGTDRGGDTNHTGDELHSPEFTHTHTPGAQVEHGGHLRAMSNPGCELQVCKM